MCHVLRKSPFKAWTPKEDIDAPGAVKRLDAIPPMAQALLPGASPYDQ